MYRVADSVLHENQMKKGDDPERGTGTSLRWLQIFRGEEMTGKKSCVKTEESGPFTDFLMGCLAAYDWDVSCGVMLELFLTNPFPVLNIQNRCPSQTPIRFSTKHGHPASRNTPKNPPPPNRIPSPPPSYQNPPFTPHPKQILQSLPRPLRNEPNILHFRLLPPYAHQFLARFSRKPTSENLIYILGQIVERVPLP